ncbi:hypothetical protein PZN02_000510 [Sinorhizobium garamanticum]|uniref:Uncharacterized protein n=1 Tax=Sinorhizobium garamanticum TaxID=680247 RepID=A0ABY8DCL7_9HYPH|nr:hypothetical protein [Sinorhizobium garamanticum]WEX88057.1 hypothetical protein PZN02_000510 [Sinorhizobium garamanticum]
MADEIHNERVFALWGRGIALTTAVGLGIALFAYLFEPPEWLVVSMLFVWAGWAYGLTKNRFFALDFDEGRSSATRSDGEISHQSEDRGAR